MPNASFVQIEAHCFYINHPPMKGAMIASANLSTAITPKQAGALTHKSYPGFRYLHHDQLEFLECGDAWVGEDCGSERIPKLKSAAVHKVEVGGQDVIHEVCRWCVEVISQRIVKPAGDGNIVRRVKWYQDDWDARLKNNVRRDRVDVNVPFGIFVIYANAGLINQVFPGVYSKEEFAQIKAKALLLLGEQEAIYNNLESAIRSARDLIPNVE